MLDRIVAQAPSKSIGIGDAFSMSTTGSRSLVVFASPQRLTFQVSHFAFRWSEWWDGATVLVCP